MYSKALQYFIQLYTKASQFFLQMSSKAFWFFLQLYLKALQLFSKTYSKALQYYLQIYSYLKAFWFFLQKCWKALHYFLGELGSLGFASWDVWLLHRYENHYKKCFFKEIKCHTLICQFHYFKTDMLMNISLSKNVL